VTRILWAVGISFIVAGTAASATLDFRPDALDLVADAAFMLLGVSAATTGAIVTSRVRGNAIGPLLLALGVGVGTTLAFGAYAQISVHTSLGPLPAVHWVGWFGDWPGIAILWGVPAFLLLLFPDGHLISPRWVPAAWFIGIGVTFATVSGALLPGDVQGVSNPAALHGAAGDVVRDVTDITDLLALPVLLVAASALVVRLRRSHGVERLQLKWFTYAASLTGVGLGLTTVTHGAVSGAAFVLGLFGLVALPITAGIAILRYRLYDIDLVIRRTLIYGALTVTLGAAYLVLVLIVGLAVGRSGFAVAVSTLAVAMLFRPARTRIQGAVDRRFYRRRYDAARELEAFGARLRGELDLEALGADLRGVVVETVQPAHVSLWLRSDP
jgi:hypothetical protein